VKAERRQLRIAILLALPMSQLGHALAYALQRTPQDSGVHRYFPNLLAGLEGLTGAAVLGALLVVVLAHLLNPGLARRGRPARLAPLLVALLTVQLLIYLFQETAELAHVGRLPSTGLLLWGVAGQLPVALVAALALRWLSVRFEPALRALSALEPAWLPAALVVATARTTGLVAVHSQTPGLEQHGPRAPPSLLTA